MAANKVLADFAAAQAGPHPSTKIVNVPVGFFREFVNQYKDLIGDAEGLRAALKNPNSSDSDVIQADAKLETTIEKAQSFVTSRELKSSTGIFQMTFLNRE
jgi:hypothetical protein